VLLPREAAVEEQKLRLPGRAGDIVRVGLALGSASARGDRFAWGAFVAPRVMGRGPAESLPPAPLTPAEEALGDSLRKSLAGSNVVFVILDAGRARSFSSYGSARTTTPQVDALAREGVLFERAFTPAVYTLGAMSSVWTSQYPDRHHSEVSFAARLPKDRLTLAEMLTQREALGPTAQVIWVAREGFLQKNRSAMVEFMADALRARRYFTDPKNHREMVEMVSRVTKQPPEQLDGWLFTKDDFYRSPDGTLDIAVLQDNIDKMVSLGFLKSGIDAKKYQDFSIVKEAAEKLK
jgi:hypothetical protein